MKVLLKKLLDFICLYYILLLVIGEIMRFKKFVLCLILCFSCVVLSSCASIQFTREVVNGQIRDAFCVELDKSKLSNEDYQKLSNELDKDFKAYRSAVNSWITNNFEPDGKTISYELSANIRKSIVPRYSGETEGKFYFEIYFASYGYFYLFYGQTGIEGVNENQAFETVLKDIGPFLTETKSLSKENISAFSYKYGRFASESIYNFVVNQKVISVLPSGEIVENEQTYLDKYLNLLGNSEKYNKDNILENVQLKEVFGTDEKKIFSNANDGRERSTDGIYYHYWDLNKMVADGKSNVEIFFKAPRSSAWYILGLGVSIVVVALVYLLSRTQVLKEIDKALTLDYFDDNDEDSEN